MDVASTPLSSRVCAQEKTGRTKLVSKSQNLSTYEKSAAHTAELVRSRSPLERSRSPPKKKSKCSSQGVREMSCSQTRSYFSRSAGDEDGLSIIDVQRLTIFDVFNVTLCGCVYMSLLPVVT